MPGADPGLEGFERLLRDTHRTVFQVAYAVLANAADAEEVTQDAFLRAYQKFSSLRDPQKFRGWVARMSWRLALNRRRADFRALRRDGAWLQAGRCRTIPRRKRRRVSSSRACKSTSLICRKSCGQRSCLAPYKDWMHGPLG